MLTGFAAATIIKLKCIQRLDEILNLTAEMYMPGWTETRLKSILGDNWLRLLGRFWHGA
jgi:membrane dipeptidase